MTAIGADKNRKWTARDWLTLFAVVVAMALAFWAMGDPITSLPPLPLLLPFLGLLLAGLMVRGVADARVRWRGPRGRKGTSPLQAVSDTDISPETIPRPRVDAALDALSTTLYALGPAWMVWQTASRGDWLRSAVLAMFACAILWAALKQAGPLFQAAGSTRA